MFGIALFVLWDVVLLFELTTYIGCCIQRFGFAFLNLAFVTLFCRLNRCVTELVYYLLVDLFYDCLVGLWLAYVVVFGLWIIPVVDFVLFVGVVLLYFFALFVWLLYCNWFAMLMNVGLFYLLFGWLPYYGLCLCWVVGLLRTVGWL